MEKSREVNIVRKILNWIVNIGIGLLIVLIVLSLVSKYNRSDYILNFAPMKVLSGSMEPQIKVGDMVIAKKIEPCLIEEGDIISYRMNNKVNVTHRVLEVFNEYDDFSFKTKGDANNIEDSELVLEDNVIGKLVFRVPKVGYFIDFMTKPLGFLALFILPITILLGSEAISYVKQ